MSGNLVALDLRKYTAADAAKIEVLQDKIRMLRRWCRCERVDSDGIEYFALYSGDRGNQPYASYRVFREVHGAYLLHHGRSNTLIATGRTIDAALDALPDDFYFARY